MLCRRSNRWRLDCSMVKARVISSLGVGAESPKQPLMCIPALRYQPSATAALGPCGYPSHVHRTSVDVQPSSSIVNNQRELG
ncbi:hypothetical protein Tco_1304191 [Tanacetum coccineum]